MPKPSSPDPAEPPSSDDARPEQEVLQAFLQQQGRVKNQLSRWIACRATAADLCQELFIRLWRRKEVPVDDLGPYLMRSARNMAIDHLRSERSRLRTESALLPEQLFAEPNSLADGHQASHELAQVQTALRGLPERTRHIFLLNRIHGKSYSEIASLLDISASAVEKHMMRALQACKSSLGAPIAKASS